MFSIPFLIGQCRVWYKRADHHHYLEGPNVVQYCLHMEHNQ